MKRTLITLLLICITVIPSTAQHRLFPSQRKKSETDAVLKENIWLHKQIDSLLDIIEQLRAGLESSDTLGIEVFEEGNGEPEQEFTQEITDSLLFLWYERNRNMTMEEEYNLDSVRFTSDVPDSVFINRLKKMNSFISLPFNETVKNYMILYSEKNREKMKRILALSKYYMPIFEEILDKYDMPLELKYMSVIESALNPIARSRVGARGLWQFMYSTGKYYGLNITSFEDERMDVEKATDAAARYLLDAYNTFGDWCLAISSYNCGAGNVNKAIRRSGGKRDFWSIYPYLPRETRGYMPAMVGAMYAMTYAKEYGLYADESYELPSHVDTFEIHKNLHFKQLNEVIGVPIEIVRELNPQYTHDIIPGDEGCKYLKLPFNYTSLFLENEDSLYRHKADTLLSKTILKNISQGGNGESTRYVVKNGDYLGKIASRYHVSVNQIKQWNGLKSNNIRIGQVLYIYSGSGPASNSKATGSTSTDADGYTIYTVRSGDSLYLIAKNFPGVSANDIMALNGIGSSIKPGMKLKIPKK